MPTARFGLVLTSIGDCVFAIGGDDGRHVCSANESYVLAAKHWNHAAPLPQGLAGGRGETHGGQIYYVGGCCPNDELSDAVYIYSPESDCWSRACFHGTQRPLSLNVGRSSFAMTLVGGGAFEGKKKHVVNDSNDPNEDRNIDTWRQHFY